MRTKHLYVLIHIRNKGEVGTTKLVLVPVSSLFNYHSKAVLLFLDPFCYLCLVSVMLSLWSPFWKGLTSWLCINM